MIAAYLWNVLRGGYPFLTDACHCSANATECNYLEIVFNNIPSWICVGHLLINGEMQLY